jgi:hypothetical protein
MGQALGRQDLYLPVVRPFVGIKAAAVHRLWNVYKRLHAPTSEQGFASTGFGLNKASFVQLFDEGLYTQDFVSKKLMPDIAAYFDLLNNDADRAGVVDAVQAMTNIALVADMGFSEKLHFVFKLYNTDEAQAIAFEEAQGALELTIRGWYKIMGCPPLSSAKCDELSAKIFLPCVVPKLMGARYAPEEEREEKGMRESWSNVLPENRRLITSNDFTKYTMENEAALKKVTVQQKRQVIRDKEKTARRNAAAIKIQGFMRGIVGKGLMAALRRMRRLKQEEELRGAATKLQRCYRGGVARTKYREKFLLAEHAKRRKIEEERKAMRAEDEYSRHIWTRRDEIQRKKEEWERRMKEFNELAGVPMERTLALILPHCVENGDVPAIMEVVKENGFEVLFQKEVQMTVPQFDSFFGIYLHRPFWHKLRVCLTKSPLQAMVLQRHNAIEGWQVSREGRIVDYISTLSSTVDMHAYIYIGNMGESGLGIVQFHTYF